jgi:hypothetical protein
MPMPPMLGFTVHAFLDLGRAPYIVIGQGRQNTFIHPANAADCSYWIAILDANNPLNKVKEFIVSCTNNAAVPAGLDTYMSNPAYLFVVATQSLTNTNVPQGDFYDYLAAHGAGRQLQRLEQLNLHTSCGSVAGVTYILTGQGGPPNSGIPAYEVGMVSEPALLVMSLMPLPNGQPPYSLCDSYTFVTR